MRDVKPILTATAMTVAACAIPVGGMSLAGVAPWHVGQVDGTGPREAVEEHIATIAAHPTPAADLLAGLADRIDDEWDVAGWVPGARPPHPLLCGSEHDAAGSFAATVTDGDQAQVYVAVYPAGLGAAELAAQVGDVRDCAASATTSTVDLGAEGYDVASLWSGTGTTTRAWRYGDVLLYVSSDSGQTMRQVADRLDELAADLTGKCLDTGSTAEDAARSPLHDGYEGWMVDYEVTIPEPEQTDATRLPDPVELVDVVLPLERPYPVWPPLPDPVDKPVEPDRPEPPATSTTVRVRQEDPDGPGCGWVFTGQAVPVFDRDAVAAKNEQTIAAARASLEEGVDEWRRELTAFWRTWPDYIAAVDAYTAYGEQVTETEQAWQPIDAAWRTYRAQEQAYRQELEAYNQAVATRRRLAAEYDEQVAACAQAADLLDQAPEPSPEPGPQPNPGDDRETPPEDEPVEDPRLAEARDVLAACPPVRPAVLDQPEPSPPVAPVPPADPRPEQR